MADNIENKYSPPVADVWSDSVASSAKWLPHLSLAITVVIVVISFVLFKNTVVFFDMFNGFGADVPALTSFFVQNRYVHFVAPFFACLQTFVTYVSAVDNNFRPVTLKISLFMVVIIASAMACAWVYAMYLPLYTLGSAD